MVADLAGAGSSPTERLAVLHDEFGLHVRSNGSVPLDPLRAVDDELGRIATALTGAPGSTGDAGGVMPLDGTSGFRLELATGGRAVVRPSGTEPLLKFYCETWTSPGAGETDRADARERLEELESLVRGAVAGV